MPGTDSGVSALTDELRYGMSSCASRSLCSTGARGGLAAGVPGRAADVSARSARDSVSPTTRRALVRPTLSSSAQAVAVPIVTSVLPARTHVLRRSTASFDTRDVYRPEGKRIAVNCDRSRSSCAVLIGVKRTPNRRSSEYHTAPYDVCDVLSSAITAMLGARSEEHTSELQSLAYLVCRLLLEKKKK